MDPTSVSVIMGAILTVVAILVTMIWTIREMYIHEARFADAQLFVSVATASSARTEGERQAWLSQAKEWYRISNEYVFVANRQSEIATLLLMTELLLAATLAATALGDSYNYWPVVTGTFAGLAALTFVSGMVGIYNRFGRVRFTALQAIYRRVARALASALPFLASPWPDHWPEINQLISGIPELNAFARNPYDTEPLAREILELFNRKGKEGRQKTRSP
jgi:hypothetical protein